MKNEQILASVLVVGQEAIQALTVLASHIDRLGRETDAELISGNAREVAGVVISIIDQMIPDSAV